MMQTEDASAAFGLVGSLIDPDSGEWVAEARHTVAYGGRHGSSAERYYRYRVVYRRAWVSNPL